MAGNAVAISPSQLRVRCAAPIRSSAWLMMPYSAL